MEAESEKSITSKSSITSSSKTIVKESSLSSSSSSMLKQSSLSVEKSLEESGINDAITSSPTGSLSTKLIALKLDDDSKNDALAAVDLQLAKQSNKMAAASSMSMTSKSSSVMESLTSDQQAKESEAKRVEAPTMKTVEAERAEVPKAKEQAAHNGEAQVDKQQETSDVSKSINLQKIFTPATDNVEILPRTRKLYASSAFYSPTLHPTVEDQVELARRISHSLSDISNQKSKGQSMYVNRKKRSVKWVHESSGQDATTNYEQENEQEFKENNDLLNEATTKYSPHDKVPLKLLMNPRGQIRDINSVCESINTETGLLSPDKCAELVTALQTQKGRGAELFAKRRKKAENWVVDETRVGIQSPIGLTDYQQYPPKPPVSPSVLPAYSDTGKHRVQLNMHQEQVLEKYAKPTLKVVKTPWEAALETGSASTAFIEEQARSPHYTPLSALSPTSQYVDAAHNRSDVSATATVADYGTEYHQKLPTQSHTPPVHIGSNHQRDLAYKPSIPQGWKAPGVSLPRELYVPKEIPLDSYAPPPTAVFRNLPSTNNQSAPFISPKPAYSEFPINMQSSDGFPTKSNAVAPKQQHWAPESYQTAPQTLNQSHPQYNFNPSPLPYDKLAKFENPSPTPIQSSSYYSPHGQNELTAPRSKVRNVSPAPYGSQAYGSPSGGQTPTFQNNLATSISPLPISQSFRSSHENGYRPQAPPQSRFNANKLLHSPNFNSSARGWKSYGGNRSYYPPPKVVSPTISSSLPYTDF